MADIITPFAIRTIATLGVPDVVRDGPVPLESIARQCRALPDPLGRVLRYLVHHGMFTEPEPDVFGPNETSHALRSDRPGSQRAWLDMDGAVGRADLAFVELLTHVRGQETAYTAVFGRGFWQELADDEQLSDSFDALMESKTHGLAPLVAQARSWDAFSSIADIGGGKGLLLAEILAEHPDVSGVLVELPGPSGNAADYLRQRDVAGRVEIVTADFLEPLPRTAHALLLCDVLGDWDDAEATRLLRNCAAAAEEGGRVFVVEVLPEHDIAEHPSAADATTMDVFTELDLRMMVYVGGRMRDLAAVRGLADAAGLDLVGVTTLDNGYALIECLPREQPD
ncbi:methyltransferase [Salinifilum aidingensis]